MLRPSLYKVIVILFSFALPLSSEISQANQKILTNIEAFNACIHDIANDVLHTYEMEDTDTLHILQIEDDNPLTHYIYERFLYEWGNQKEVILTQRSQSNNKKPVLYLLPPVKAGVIYSNIFKKGFFRKTYIERKAYIELSIRCHLSNEPVKIRQFKKELVDIVPKQLKHYIEQQGMILGPVAIPPRQNRDWIETGLALITTSIVVYLFYIIRSE